MRGGVSLNFGINLLSLFLLFLGINESHCGPLDNKHGTMSTETQGNGILPAASPSGVPQPFIPFLAPSQAPFRNNSVPRLSGLCKLNFSAAESMMNMAATDCWASFAPFLANVVCCPQLEATLVVLIGRSSKDTGVLALNGTHAKHCLSDVQQILVSQGASENLQKICSVHPLNLTEASCPVKDVNEFVNSVNSSKLLTACENIDPVNECCSEICQNAISEAASNIASRGYGLSSMDGHVLPEHSTRIEDCKSIVLRWLASRLDPSPAREVLRGLSNCNLNKVCPLVFPGMKNVAKGCGNGMSNQTACCSAMESYVSHLQKQSFITNLQALDCASSLGLKLQKANITKNVYSLCHITLKDFSLQVGSQESGCLLPSLPSDATFDKSSGISFLCDLNDNIAAPWPSASELAPSACNKSMTNRDSAIKIPALPAATSAQSGLYREDLVSSLLFASSLLLMIMLV